MSSAISDCYPLSLTRKIEDFPIANVPLKEHQQWIIGDEKRFHCHPHAWLTAQDFAAFCASGKATLASVEGEPLLWQGASADKQSVFITNTSFLIRYAWDFLRANETFISSFTESHIQGNVHPAAAIEGVIHLGENSRILPGVYIEGNVVIGANCKIGPNCYIRGNTSVGDNCHIGQAVEIKNSILLSHTNVGHLSYIGDSILGEKVNFGAGTITSNLRHDGKNHRTTVDGELVDTGRRKFGAIVGDRVHTGIHTAIYPGRKIWPGAMTRPGEIVQRDILS